METKAASTEKLEVEEQKESGDENAERGNWTGRLDFLLACIGFAVGLGNVWRFPYLCYRNGGGAFLIPYVLMLALAGLPLFFMELSLGQFASLGPISLWKLAPFFKGIGYCMVTISALVCIYYNIIITYVIFYFFASFGKEVPWAHCGNKWNTPFCVEKGRNVTGDNMTTMAPLMTAAPSMMTSQPRTPADEYFRYHVLEMTDGIGEPGNVRWQLALCLLLAWTVVFLCLIKGVKSTGKVVYFTATFPYVVLTILLIRGVTLPGAREGIEFYIVPKWERLKDAKVWGDAAIQIFYSLGPGWGGLITMASYNRFHNNCYKDALIVAVTNCATSVYAGFVIFSVIGYMAHELNVPVDNVTDSGPGLAFVAYPEGIARMPVAPLWAVLFFFMLFTLGLDSMFAMFETVISALTDEFPKYLKERKMLLTFGLSVFFFLLGLPQVTQGGVYVMNLMDWYSAGFSLLFVGLFEVTVLMYIYGYKRFSKDIESMIGFRPNPYWIVTWHVLTPAFMIFIIVFSSVSFAPVKYDGLRYPNWADALGWLMVAAALMWIPIMGLVKLWQVYRSNQRFTFESVFGPDPDWGPALPEHRAHRASLDPPIGGAIISSPGVAADAHFNGGAAVISGNPPPYNGLGSYDNPGLVIEDEKKRPESTHL